MRILKIFVIKKRESKFLNPRSTKYGIHLNQHFMQKFAERNFLPFPALTKIPYEIFANLEKNPGFSPSPSKKRMKNFTMGFMMTKMTGFQTITVLQSWRGKMVNIRGTS